MPLSSKNRMIDIVLVEDEDTRDCEGKTGFTIKYARRSGGQDILMNNNPREMVDRVVELLTTVVGIQLVRMCEGPEEVPHRLDIVREVLEDTVESTMNPKGYVREVTDEEVGNQMAELIKRGHISPGGEA